MTDLQAALLLAIAAVVLWAYLQLCERLGE